MFDPLYQIEPNGPLTEQLRNRINAFRTIGSTQADIGKVLGFSPSFVSQMLNPRSPARVDSKHIPRIIRLLAQHERKNWKELSLVGAVEDSDEPKKSATDKEIIRQLKKHIQEIHTLGFEVTGLLPL